MTEYTKLDQLLHRLALSIPILNDVLLDIEQIIFDSNNQQHCQPVFVTGYARAGTTILMRALYATGEFSSLTYNDMPFVMSPNLWSKVSRFHKKKRDIKERAHGDGIKVSSDSPEALEEVFWRSMHGKEYIGSHSLKTHVVPKETCIRFRKYQNLVCKRHRRPRYLSKNNNHILRLPSLAMQCPEATFLVLFRDPVSQARSLLRQHIKFLASDSFTIDYMNWLAHHEFGITHKPFVFSNEDNLMYSPKTLEYWIIRWSEAYQHLLDALKLDSQNMIPVSYERLCDSPKYWDNLCQLLNLPTTNSPFVEPKNLKSYKIEYSALSNALSIYQQLDELTRTHTTNTM